MYKEIRYLVYIVMYYVGHNIITLAPIPSVNNRIVRTHRRRTVERRLVFDKLKYFNRSE